MIKREEIQEIARGYGKNVKVGIFGSHSAMEVGSSAKTYGFETVLYVEKGRDALYTEFNRHLYDETIVLDKFKDILKQEHQDHMIQNNVIFFPNRSFSVYLKKKGAENEYECIENDFKVPLGSNRGLLRTEDRKDEKGQYHLMKAAGVRIAPEFKKPEDIDRLAIVKVQQAGKELERAFFYVVSPDDYHAQVEVFKKAGLIDDEVLKKSRIEEFVFGPRFNANFHAYGLQAEFGLMDFVGFSDRRQVNLHGLLNLPAKDQLKLARADVWRTLGLNELCNYIKELSNALYHDDLLKLMSLPELPKMPDVKFDVQIRNEEIGHMGITMRESQKILPYIAAKKLLTSETLLNEYPPGMLGPFGLQGAIQYSPEDNKTLEFVAFDLSPRIPGDPAIGPSSPEMRNLMLKLARARYNLFDYSDLVKERILEQRRNLDVPIESPLDLIMIEMHAAIREKKLEHLVT
jgi:5-formaminoimidazole-4-carboxamide-1-(beta)-D-ribofuranosyl 5'-monophosphate synthetase